MSAAIKRVMVLTVGLMMLGAAAIAAPRRGAVVVVPRGFVHGPSIHDPFWGPWYPYSYGYPYAVRSGADIRTEVTPKDALVYVDGYYAGQARDFDGAFKRLHVVPGGHAITFSLDGFRTVTEDVYVRPDSTLKMHANMQRLTVGEMSAPVPNPVRPPALSYEEPVN